jgi:hypothetical protein
MPLEVLIPWLTSTLIGVTITAINIALPDFDAQVAERAAIDIQYPATQVGNLALRPVITPLNKGQVVIIIERQLQWIKRTGALPRRRDQVL